MSIDERRVVKVTHACVLAHPHNTAHRPASDMICLLSLLTFIILLSSMQSRAFYRSFGAITQSGTYENQHGTLR